MNKWDWLSVLVIVGAIITFVLLVLQWKECTGVMVRGITGWVCLDK